MKTLIKQGVLLLLVLGTLCVHGVIAADTAPDVLTRASIFIDAGRLKDAVAVLKGHEPRDAKEEQQITLLMGKIYLAIDRPAKALEYFRSADEQISFNMDAVMGRRTRLSSSVGLQRRANMPSTLESLIWIHPSRSCCSR